MHNVTPLQYVIWPRDVSSSRTRLQPGKQGATLDHKLCRSFWGQQLTPSLVNTSPPPAAVNRIGEQSRMRRQRWYLLSDLQVRERKKPSPTHKPKQLSFQTHKVFFTPKIKAAIFKLNLSWEQLLWVWLHFVSYSDSWGEKPDWYLQRKGNGISKERSDKIVGQREREREEKRGMDGYWLLR